MWSLTVKGDAKNAWWLGRVPSESLVQATDSIFFFQATLKRSPALLCRFTLPKLFRCSKLVQGLSIQFKCSKSKSKFYCGLLLSLAILISGLLFVHALHVCSRHLFGLPLRMNGMHITQFDYWCLGILSLVIWSRVVWPSVTRNLCKAQRWSKSALIFDHCCPHPVTFGYY